MVYAYICDALRTPFGKYAGTLSSVRTDDLASMAIRALVKRNPQVDWDQLDELVLGCANQAGEDNRNVARMAGLLSGINYSVPGVTVNRLCASGLEAVGYAHRAIRCGEMNLVIAGGVESMSRAPLVMGKADQAFARNVNLFDTTIGWRFINPKMQAMYGVDSMPETAENLAQIYGISRDQQDAFALLSQQKVQRALKSGFFQHEIVPVPVGNQEVTEITLDEHPRLTSLSSLAKLRPIVHATGSVTAGNSSGINDGACALVLANEKAIKDHALIPKVRILGMTSAGVEPRIMGFGPVPAIHKLLAQQKLTLDQIDIIEINEAFAVQVLAVLQGLGLDPHDIRVNPNGGAIALGHPLGASGARLATTAMYQLVMENKKLAIVSLCVGVGQGLAMLLERV
ncbi:MAG: 3-oxoadipyl-CoA thiolase [Gammaproteobacteria bacterium]|nr:3-oxoadipyl-CoA thiolase [Gammaproteobacteria bacterium]